MAQTPPPAPVTISFFFSAVLLSAGLEKALKSQSKNSGEGVDLLGERDFTEFTQP